MQYYSAKCLHAAGRHITHDVCILYACLAKQCLWIPYCESIPPVRHHDMFEDRHWWFTAMTTVVVVRPLWKASSWLTLIIVTGFAVCQLLKVSKMTNQAAAVLGLQALEEWVVQDHVTGMCFDTNSSNVASVLALVLNFKECWGKIYCTLHAAAL